MTCLEGLWWKEGRIVVPQSPDARRLLLELLHDNPLERHFKVTKTLKSLNSRFYWPYADREVREYVKRCPTCQMQNVDLAKPAGLLRPLEIPAKPFHTITTD